VLPPVLDIYLVWHPDDDHKARPIAEAIIDHYQGDCFSGLLGGAVEVFVRSAGWHGPGSAPRPVPLPGDAGPVRSAARVVVLALLGPGLAAATSRPGPWSDWLQRVRDAAEARPAEVRLWGLALCRSAVTSTGLQSLFADRQLLASPDVMNDADDTMLMRDLSQSLTQFLRGSSQPIKVFISHSKHMDPGTEQAIKALVATVRMEVLKTRLAEFFDSAAIQTGDDWAAVLKRNAAEGAMLCLRTDSYAGREWCHREVVTAKLNGVPVVALDALQRGDGRGSFLLDHIPRVPARRKKKRWSKHSIREALLRLVDECLKRALWQHQEILARGLTPVSWWAPHAPEPLTLADRLTTHRPVAGQPLVILHPDPPLTPCERQALGTVAALAGIPADTLDILTPRTLSARS